MKPPPVPPPTEHLLELNIISAQDLHPVNRSMSTYAVTWIHPDRKLCSRVDSGNHTDPQWNDKFVFRVDEWFLRKETSAVMVEIFCVGWLRDVLVGTVRVLIGNLLSPKVSAMGMRFTALQVRRPSGRPQGILNLGVTVLDASLRSVPLYTQLNPALGYKELMGNAFRPLHKTKSLLEVGSAASIAERASSSDAGGSGEDILPEEVGSSVLEDWSVASRSGKEVKAKLERWRNEFPPQPAVRRRLTAQRRKEAGGGPALCFGDKFSAGCECSVSCGTNARKKMKKGDLGKLPLSPSATGFA